MLKLFKKLFNILIFFLNLFFKVPDQYNQFETKDEKKEFVAELWKAPAENPVMSSKLICNFLQPSKSEVSALNVQNFNKTYRLNL